MRLHTNKLLFILISIFLLSGFSFPYWTEFTSVEGRFRILTPGDLTLKTKDIETPVGMLTYHSYIYQSTEKEADNLVYLVSYCDYPEHSVSSDSIELAEEFFETTVSSAAKSVKGEVRYATDIKLKHFPGKLWRVDYNEGNAQIKTKAFLVKNRYYSVQTVTLKKKGLNTASDKFLDSFNIIQ